MDASQDMVEFVEYVARALVDEPEAVDVHAIEGAETIAVELTVAEHDLGKVIGRQGRMARSLRTLLSALATKHQRRVVLDILE